MAKQTAVVIGATLDGIGSAVTNKLLDLDYRIIGTYNSSEKEKALEFLKGRANLDIYEVNLESREELKRFVQEIAGIEIATLVNVEFFFAIEDPSNFDYNLWDKSIAVNLSAPNYLIHELKDQIKSEGSIVVVTSTEGFIGSFGASAYGATKAAIHNLIKTLANNLGHRKIRVNAVAPGWIGGVMDTDEVFNLSRQITPLARLGAPEEIANTVAFLVSDQSSFVNGTVLVADGGYTGVDTISKYEFEAAKKNF